MNKEQADKLGRAATEKFVKTYERLVLSGYQLNARAMILTTFPYVIATILPKDRPMVMADIFEVYRGVGREIYEDGLDLYDAITKNFEPKDDIEGMEK